jgi:putative inorganic carbon (hco3(-)) transporter
VLVVVVGAAHLLECWGLARRAPSMVPFACLTGVAALSLAVAPSFTHAAPELVRLARIGVVYGLAFVLPQTRRQLSALVAVTLLSVLPVIGVALYQMAGSPGRLGRGAFQFHRATGGFTVADELGILLGLLLCFAVPLLLTLPLRHRLPMAIWTGLAGVALFGSYGRTGWIGLAAGLLVVGVVRYRSLLVAAPVLVAIVALTVPTSVQRFADLNRPATSESDPTDTLRQRMDLWRQNLPKVNQAPVLGLGLDAIAVQEGRLVHSDFVRAAVELGLVGLAAYVWLLLSGLIGSLRALRATRRAALRRGDLLVALSAASAGAVVMFILASGDSNLITKPVPTGSVWLLIGAGHAAGRLATQAGVR